MEQRTKQGMRCPDNWGVRLLRVHMTLTGLGGHAEPSGGEDGWPARLIHVGAMLVGVSGVVLATWLRRHLQQ